MEIDDIPIGDTIHYTTVQCGLNYHLTDNTILITNENLTAQPLITRRYKVSLKRLNLEKDKLKLEPQTLSSGESDFPFIIERQFTQLGLKFPERLNGETGLFDYDLETEEAIIRSTASELDKVPGIIAQLPISNPESNDPDSTNDLDLDNFEVDK